MKKCPFCAEEIQDEAIKCRFCGEYLKKKWWKNCLFSCLVVFALLLVLTPLFSYLIFFAFKFIVYKLFFAGQNLPQHYPPFTGQGIEGIVREFSEVFKALWERLKDYILGERYVTG